jgi:SRSO17 transposase
MTRAGARLRRAQPRRRARAFALGLPAELPRVNCRAVAGHAGDFSPDGMGHLLARARRDADGVRDDVRGYVAGHPCGPGAVLVAGQTGDLNKGTATAGAQRQYAGAAGRIENAQVAVCLGYSARPGTRSPAGSCTCRSPGPVTRSAARRPGSRRTRRSRPGRSSPGR